MKSLEPFSSVLMEALTHSESYIMAASEDGTLLFGNEAFCKPHHLNPETDINRVRIPEFSLYIDEERWKLFVKQLKKEGSRRNILMHHPLPDQSDIQVFIGDMYYLKTKDGKGVIWGIGKDLTQVSKKQKELALDAQQLIIEKEKAEQSDKNKSIFLANMSHEIRTPLNAIMGFSRLIAENQNAEERRSYYELVASSSERLLHLINEILDLSKMEAGKIKFAVTPVDLQQLCNDVYQLNRLRSPEGVAFAFEPSEKNLRISTDRNRIIQVLNNLIGNAFKHTAQGSVNFGYKQEGKYITFHVTDTGTGIPENKIDNVFDRFVKVHDEVEGTGLGLSISKLIVEQLGGNISVASRLGEGSTFSFTLPNRLEEEEIIETSPHTLSATNKETKPESTQIRKDAEGKPQAKGRKKSVLLVAEDELTNYTLVKVILNESYQLLHAKDGVKAIELFKENKPDLILMDLRMPNMGGLDATKAIREIASDIPIIACTAYAFDSDKEAVLEAGCNDFLPKPFTQEQLKNILLKWQKE
ncbi:MAG: response regulator [Mediterranea sp.]|jgi:signal transduction histidine kinase/CheY-like chemotaxis protein|nr:response regulator [Mediterranea sp.]